MGNYNQRVFSIIFSCILFNCIPIFSQIIESGAGSYTTRFPGVDQANRNTFPNGNPYLSGLAADKPVPTNDWWSAQIKNPHADNLFNYPTP